MFSTLKAILWPLPISPSTLAAGTGVSSKERAHVEEPFRPSFFSSGPTVKPGESRSTMNAVKCSPSTLAKTMKRSAKPALVMNCFDPLRT